MAKQFKFTPIKRHPVTPGGKLVTFTTPEHKKRIEEQRARDAAFSDLLFGMGFYPINEMGKEKTATGSELFHLCLKCVDHVADEWRLTLKPHYKLKAALEKLGFKIVHLPTKTKRKAK